MTSYINVDLIIISLFLVFNIVIGIWYGRNVKSMQDYAFGGRPFNTAMLTATLVSTYISGNHFFTIVSISYSQYIRIIGVYLLGMTIWLILTYHIMLPKIGCFIRNKTSIAEVFDQLHGKHNGLIVALISIALSICVIAGQVKVLGIVFKHLFNVHAIWAIIISTLVVIAYSTFGGIKSVILTDLFQSLVIGAFLPVMLILIWQLDGNKNCYVLIHNITSSFQCISRTDAISLICMLIFTSCPGGDPALFRVLFIAKDIEQAKKSVLFFSIVYLCFIAVAASIGVILQTVNVNINNEMPIILYVVDNYMSVATGLKGFVIIGIIAMTMSTTDSYINTASIIAVNSICIPLGIEKKSNPLLVIKICSILIGLVGMCIALHVETLFKLLTTTSTLYMTAVSAPLTIRLLGFNVSNIAVTAGIVTGMTTTILWSSIFLETSSCPYDLRAEVAGICTNILAIILTFYITKVQEWWKRQGITTS